MSTFDSTKASLSDLLREIDEGKIQLPNFQRGWIWDDDHIRDLLVSIARSFPIGAVMLLEAGGEVRFQTRPVGAGRLVSVTTESVRVAVQRHMMKTAATIVSVSNSITSSYSFMCES